MKYITLKLILTFGIFFFENNNVNCMDIQKNIASINRNKYEEIHKILSPHGLYGDIFKIIHSYCGYYFYDQLDSTNGGHTDGAVIALGSCGKLLFSYGNDSTIKIWNLDSFSKDFKSCIYTISVAANAFVEAIAINNKYLAYTNSLNIEIHDLDIKSKSFGSCIHTIDETNGGHDGPVRALAWSKNLLASAGSAGDEAAIKIWDMDEHNTTFKSCIHTITHADGGHDNNISALAFCDKYLASGSWDETIKIWDMDSNSKNFKNCIHTIVARDVIRKLSSNGKYLGYTTDASISIWDLDNNSSTFKTRVGLSVVEKPLLAFCDKFLFYCKSNREYYYIEGNINIKILDITKSKYSMENKDNKEIKKEVENKTFMSSIDSIEILDSVQALTFCDKYLITGDHQGNIQIWANGDFTI